MCSCTCSFSSLSNVTGTYRLRYISVAWPLATLFTFFAVQILPWSVHNCSLSSICLRDVFTLRWLLTYILCHSNQKAKTSLHKKKSASLCYLLYIKVQVLVFFVILKQCVTYLKSYLYFSSASRLHIPGVLHTSCWILPSRLYKGCELVKSRNHTFQFLFYHFHEFWHIQFVRSSSDLFLLWNLSKSKAASYFSHVTPVFGLKKNGQVLVVSPLLYKVPSK